MGVLLGLDAGTTTIRAVAFTSDGTVRAVATETQSVAHPHSGWAEQQMDAVWEASASAIRSVLDELDDGTDVLGVGLTGQGDGCWLCNEDGSPVRNAVLWSDSRAAPILEQWEADGTMTAIAAECGSSMYPGMSLPLLAWFADHEPDSLERATTAFGCKDWIAFRLTGVRSTDYSEATVPFLDADTEQFNPDVFELAGLSEYSDLLPEIRSGTDTVGEVTEQAAEATGLPTGTPVVAGMIDVVASAIGAGAVAPGDAAVSLGTSVFTQTIAAGHPDSDTGIGMAFGVDGRWTTAVGSNAGTQSIEWVRTDLCDDLEYSTLESAAESVSPGCDGLIYLPYLSSTGERAPFTNSNARAGYVGMVPDHTRAHLIRSVYEGLSLAVRDCLEHLPVAPDRVYLTGGGARSSFWCEMLADVLDVELVVPQADFPAAKGAATLLAVGLELVPDIEAATTQLAGERRTYQPTSPTTQTYAELYEGFRSIREELPAVWRAHAELRARQLEH